MLKVAVILCSSTTYLFSIEIESSAIVLCQYILVCNLLMYLQGLRTFDLSLVNAMI